MSKKSPQIETLLGLFDPNEQKAPDEIRNCAITQAQRLINIEGFIDDQFPSDADFVKINDQLGSDLCDLPLLLNIFQYKAERDENGEINTGFDIVNNLEENSLSGEFINMALDKQFDGTCIIFDPAEDGNCEELIDLLLEEGIMEIELPIFLKSLRIHVPMDPCLPVVSVVVEKFDDRRQKKWVVQEPFTPDDFEKIRSNLCHTWPFELDLFQKQAIVCLDRSQYVFVAAHTSAGKTVVAEYAVALALQHNTRCFYCSPIKALSNQKYKEFKNIFGDVGLLTGDNQLNQDASVVIMTTEILRTMLYNRKDNLSNLEYLIFDEVHYVNDPERGMVWEEVFILIPSTVTLVMLSATVSNAADFAEWVGSTKGQPVHLVTTSSRPIPLVHYIFTGVNEGTRNEMFLLKSDQIPFSLTNYKLAEDAFNMHNGNGSNRGMSFKRERNVWLTLIRSLDRQQLLPAIAFIFSRHKIDKLAEVVHVLNLNSDDERNQVQRVMQNAIDRVPRQDRELKQIRQICDLTERGIGIHHSGILPIMKEYVENLFSMGLIKLLLATETFAMGVNMPARTVIFGSITKFDGNNYRDLSPGEYTQMSGRAGRRGIDHTGQVVILCTNRLSSSQALENMINGEPMPLLSKFKLNFNIILNIERHQSFSVLDMVKSSFGQYTEQCSMLANVNKLSNLQVQQKQFSGKKSLPTSVENCSVCTKMPNHPHTMKQYVEQCDQFWPLHNIYIENNLMPALSRSQRFNRIGQCLFVFTKRFSMVPAILFEPVDRHDEIVKVIVPRYSDLPASDALLRYEIRPVGPRYTSTFSELVCTAVPVTSLIGIIRFNIELSLIDIFQNRRYIRFNELTQIPISYAYGQHLSMRMAEFMKQQIDVQILLRETRNILMGAWNNGAENCRSHENLLHGLIYSPVLSCRMVDAHRKEWQYFRWVESEIERLKYSMSDENLYSRQEYMKRIKFLQQLSYITNNGAITQKGIAACQIAEGEILLMELVTDGFFNKYSVPVIAGALSCLAAGRGSNNNTNNNNNNNTFVSEVDYKARTKIAYDEMQPAIKHIMGITWKLMDMTSQLGIDANDTNTTIRSFEYSIPTYFWTTGESFMDVMEMTEIQEGLLVRCILRTSEILRSVATAVEFMSFDEVAAKIKTVLAGLKRDVAYIPSLYIN